MYLLLSIIFVTCVVATAYGQVSLCPPNRIYFAPTNSCYERNESDIQPYNWTAAKNSCDKFHAYLASIHSAEEANFISQTFSNVSDYLWIGLYWNVIIRHDWAWLSNDPVDYFWWATGSPGTKNFVALANGVMNTFDCEDLHYGICKKPAGVFHENESLKPKVIEIKSTSLFC